MPDSRRLLRLQQLVLETIAMAVIRELDDPRIVGVSITRVRLARDLSRASVYWSTLDTGGPRRTAERGLADCTPYLQARVAEVMETRFTPHLTLRFDESTARSSRIQDIFFKLAAERGEAPDAATPADAASPEGDAAPDADATPEGDAAPEGAAAPEGDAGESDDD